MKSSLKTFLAGKNPYKPVPGGYNTLANANSTLSQQIETGDLNNSIYLNDIHWVEGNEYRVDVLDDGTAITYCVTP